MSEHTGRATGFIAECPDVETFELAPIAPDIHDHVDVCESCQLVLELLAASAGVSVEACDRFEPLIAARADGTLGRAASNLLARHLASCDDCRAIAETLAPTADIAGDLSALPRVAPESYALGLEVDRGGMGRILAARDLRIGRPVALKELLGRSQQLAARFEREARITARLQHPGIVPIYEIGRWPDGTPFYTMRMVDGHTLRKAIGAAATLAERLVLLPAVIAASEAVAFAHAQRIIHRDLTPSNVLVGAYGETVVIDWGLAKDVSHGHSDEVDTGPDRVASSELTGVGAVVGTAAYMPPEQAHAGSVDERADVYALGAILYHLLAGKPPYHGSDDMLAAVQAGPPRAIEDLAPTAPRDLRSIVAKAMARHADARYPTARELAEELKRFQTGRMVEAHEYTTGERMRRFLVRNRAPLVVTGIALLILAGFGVVAVRRVVRERAAAQRTVRALLEEEGRDELLAGNSQRALAYFDEEAADRRPASPALRFMRAQALREMSTVIADLDCGGTIRDLAFSPDKTLLVASCHDVAKAWRLSDRTLIATYGPFENGFDHLTYSNNGAIMVTYGGDGDARVWNVATNRLIRTIHHAPSSTITFATFDAADTRLATSGYDGWARIWDINTGALIREIRGSDALILRHLYGLLSRDGRRLLTFTIEGIGAGWDVATGAKLGEVQHGSLALGGELSPSGTLAATCGLNRVVKLWDTTSPRLVAQLAGATDAIVACKFSADGTRVIGTGFDGHAYVWDVASGAMITSVDHGTAVWTGHFSADGTRFVTVGVGGGVKVWDTETGGPLTSHDTRGGHEAAFSPDGSLLIAARGDGRIRIWSDPSGPLTSTFDWPAMTYDVATTRDGRTTAVEAVDGWIAIHSTATGATIATQQLAAPIAASAHQFAATTPDARIAVIDAVSGTTAVTLPVPIRPTGLAMSDDGAQVVVDYADRDSEVWDVARHAVNVRLEGARHSLVSSDGKRALGWRDGHEPRVWDLETHAGGVELGGAASFHPIGFSHDHHKVVLDDEAPNARSIAIWDADSGVKRDAVIKDVSATPTLDPGGRYLVTIVADYSIHTLDLDDGRDVILFGEQLQGAQLDPSGHLIAGVAAKGDAIVVLDADDGRELARWRIAHEPPSLQQDSFAAPHAAAWWSVDGKTIISISAHRLARWNADLELRDARGEVVGDDQLVQLVRRNVPWRVAGAKLVPALASIHGAVSRGGAAVPGATVRLVFRKPADLGTGAMSWASANFENKPLPPLVTSARGEFARDQLVPGKYALTIVAGGTSHVIDTDVDVEDRELVIDLDRLPAR